MTMTARKVSAPKSEANSPTSSAIRESLALFVANLKRDPVETALRMRALQSLSEGISIEVIQLIAEATARAKAGGPLDENLKAFLVARGAFATACQKFNSTYR